MKFAALAPPSQAANRSLPLLSGRLLAAYRLAWAVLALGAVAVLAWLVISPDMDPVVLLLRLAKGGVLLMVATILFRRRQRDVVAALLSSAFLLWTMTSSFAVTDGQAPVIATLADRLRFLLFALALLLFPAGRWSPAWTRHVAVAASGVFLLGVAETIGIAPTRAFLPLAILCVVVAIGTLLFRYRFASSHAERQQLKWIALGLTTGISLILSARAGAALNRLRNAPVLDPPVLEGLFQLGIIAIALGFLVSLLRYRLYDAETVISRSAAYAGLTLALVGTFAASESLIQTFGQRYFGPEIGDLSSGIAAAIAAVLLTPLHGRISGWAEQRFQRDLIGLKTQLPDLVAALSGGSSLARLGSAVLPHVEGALHAVRIALVVDGRVIASVGIAQAAAQRWFRQWHAPTEVRSFDRGEDDCFPLRMALRCPLGSVRSWLLLGPRPDGSFYGHDELEALQFVAAPLQRTLFAVAERQGAQSREMARLRSIARSVRSLDARLSAIETRP